jgi:hypothetical protein
VSIGNVITEHGLEGVAEVGDYDWDWSITGVYFQRSSGRFFVYSDSGCSCYSYGETVGALTDLSEVTRAQAIEALRAEGGGGYHAASADDVQREVAKVRDFR